MTFFFVIFLFKQKTHKQKTHKQKTHMSLHWCEQGSYHLSWRYVKLPIPLMLCMYVLCYVCFSPEIFQVLYLSLYLYLNFCICMCIWIYVLVFVSEFIFSSVCISLKAVFVQLDEPADNHFMACARKLYLHLYLYLYFKSFVCATGWSGSAWRWQTIISWLAPGIKILPTGRHNYQILILYKDTLLIISIQIKIKILPPGCDNHQKLIILQIS